MRKVLKVPEDSILARRRVGRQLTLHFLISLRHSRRNGRRRVQQQRVRPSYPQHRSKHCGPVAQCINVTACCCRLSSSPIAYYRRRHEKELYRVTKAN